MAQAKTDTDDNPNPAASTPPPEQEAVERDYDHLVTQIAQLKTDIGALTASLATLGRSERDRLVATARDKGEELRLAGEARVGDAQATVNDVLRDGERYVREQPGMAVGIAAFVGFVLGLFMTRR